MSVLTLDLGAPVPAIHSNASIEIDQQIDRHINRQSNLGSDDLAYVIYTFGSTGPPKGVKITHGNLRNLIAWHRETFHLTPEDIGTQFASLTFDATVLELWPVLACGATIYVPERSIVLDPKNLRDFLIEHQVTISFAATPVAERLLELTWPPECKLRYLLTGGDALKSFPSQALPFQLLNNYGPTECTVLATSGGW